MIPKTGKCLSICQKAILLHTRKCHSSTTAGYVAHIRNMPSKDTFSTSSYGFFPAYHDETALVNIMNVFAKTSLPRRSDGKEISVQVLRQITA